jgi:hypothetical protein
MFTHTSLYLSERGQPTVCPSCWFPQVAKQYGQWMQFDRVDRSYYEDMFQRAIDAHTAILNLYVPSCRNCPSYIKCLSRLIR